MSNSNNLCDRNTRTFRGGVETCIVPKKKTSIEKTGMDRAMEIRKELLGIANDYAQDNAGDVALMLHQACNTILDAQDLLMDA